jgi:hypothetical protein
MLRGLSPQRQRRLDHAPDVRLDEGARCTRQLAALVLGDLLDLGGDHLRDVPRPTFLDVDGNDPQGPIVLAVQQAPDDRRGVCLSGISLDIREARPAEVAEHQVDVHNRPGVRASAPAGDGEDPSCGDR